MAQIADTGEKISTFQLVTFHVGEALCGLDILSVRGINKRPEITPVSQAPDYVMGILNLRGQIVTVIDLGKRLGLSPFELSPMSRVIVVGFDSEDVGLLVDRVRDVVPGDGEQVEPPPANLEGVRGRFFEGVLKTGESLIGILDIEEVLREEEQGSAGRR